MRAPRTIRRSLILNHVSSSCPGPQFSIGVTSRSLQDKSSNLSNHTLECAWLWFGWRASGAAWCAARVGLRCTARPGHIDRRACDCGGYLMLRRARHLLGTTRPEQCQQGGWLSEVKLTCADLLGMSQSGTKLT